MPTSAASGRAVRHNLPAPVTTCIGRDGEVRAIRARLAEGRLLTLTGVGGCGKTRLALEVARAVLDEYPDGVWLVELGPLADLALVPHSVAAVMGVRAAAGQTSVSALTMRLRARRLLLVLDNCEHVLESCAALIDALLRACPDLQVLATSREALRISGEIAWRVPSLVVPDPLHLPGLTELQRNPAVQLFVERARAAEPRFLLSEHNAAAVAEVCARLDGIPLALELAAARVAALPVAQVAARLDQRFRLLTSGSRAALPRQRTLQATLDWSYDLLSGPERQLFERLAVFAGGWSLEAAEAVCAGDEIEPHDVLDLLARLVGKSLVVADVAPNGTGRYRLLETMREYARERLASAGRLRLLAQRHAEFFLAFVADLDTDQPLRRMTTLGSSSLLDRLEREQDNLRTALRWWIDLPDADQAARQAAGLFLIWFCRGSVAEGRAWLDELLSLPLARATPEVQKRVLPIAGYLARRHGEYAAACDLFEELLAAYDAAGDRPGAAVALLDLANVHQLRGNYPAARAALEASRTQGGESADFAFQTQWLFVAGQIALYEGQYDVARNFFSEGLRRSERIASATGVQPNELLYKAYFLVCFAAVARQQGKDAEAGALLDQGLPIVRQYGDRSLLAMFFDGYAGLAAAAGQHERAVCLEGAADALREAAGAPLGPSAKRLLQSWLQVSHSALSRAAAAAAWATGRAMAFDDAIASILASSAQTTAAPPRVVPLTPREREVAALLANGLTDRQIADKLVITEGTAGVHVSHILNKLGFHARTEIANWAVQQGLGPSSDAQPRSGEGEVSRGYI